MTGGNSATATTASESRFRVRGPNSAPRTVMVVALDPLAASLVDDLARRAWRGTTFFTAAAPTPAGSFARWLTDVTGHTADLVAEIARADIVQLVTMAGQAAPAASMIAEACALQSVKTSGLVVDDRGAGPAALSHSLAILRPFVVTLSVIGAADTAGEILHALGG